MRKLFRRILCPVAFDENSIAALELACELAWEDGSSICLLHVVPELPVDAGPVEPLREAESDAVAKLQEWARQYLQGKVQYEVIARTGDPARIIIGMVNEIAADSVVMATHGRTGLSHLILGSVAERVVRESPRPVLTTRGIK